MKTTVYRYEKLGALSRIRTEGLMPTERNMQILNGSLGSQTAVYALTRPQPTEWTHNERFPRVWDRLKMQLTPSSNPFENHGGNLLLAIDVDTQRDSVHVIDWGPMELLEEQRPWYLEQISRAEVNNDGRAEFDAREALYTRREEAWRDRKASMVPLEQYLTDPAIREKFLLPEVIILSQIPPDRIRIAHEQPLLIEHLEGSRRSVHSTLRAMVESTMKSDEELRNSRALAEWFAAEREQPMHPGRTELAW